MLFFKPLRKTFRNTWVHRLPITGLIYSKFFSLSFSGREEQITFRGINLVVPTNDITIVPSLISGEYEQSELDEFGKLLRPGMTVLDIGSNIGVYAVLAAKAVGKKGKVYACEPIDDNINFLKKNVACNKVDDKVEIVEKAVGAKDGSIRIYLEEGSIGTHSAGLKSRGGTSLKFKDVACISIDSLVKKEKIKRVDLVKIDVEGYESKVIEGMAKTIKSSSPVIFMEFSTTMIEQCGDSPISFAKQIFSLYKHVYIISERTGKISKVVQANDLIDLSSREFTGANIILANSPVG